MTPPPPASQADARSVGICGNTIEPTPSGPPLICDLLAGHPGWHGCDQPYWAAPMGRPWLTSTVSRCHWTERDPEVSE